MRIPLLIVALLLAPLAGAQIYKTVDEQGNVSFSDIPPADGRQAEEIRLRETNSTPPPPVLVRPEPAADDSDGEEAEATNYQVAISEPANETSIPMGPGNFSVSARVEPALADGALLQLYIDGSPSGSPQSGTSWGLTNVFRGAHDLTVAVVDGDGNQLAQSDPVRVFVFRPSTNFKNRN